MKARSRNQCCREKIINIKYYERVSDSCISYPACKAHAPFFHLWHAWLYRNFPDYLINGTTIEKKKVTERKTCGV